MPAERDKSTGQYTRQFPVAAFVEAVRQLERATTAKVSEEVGCSYDLAYRRLVELERAGDLRSVEVGNTYLWTVVD